ncbi:MAG: tripartite tricarboxylate transporter permease [Alphaproteobacteria bacterium]|nr:tripartite tricarboxylate transporter permease [Alphaproteobacteria bacterium]
MSQISIATLGIAALGVAIGVFLGALPGFGGGASMAICLPLALAMTPLDSMVFLINIYGGVHYGGGIPSVLLGMPGDAGAAATVMDGYRMTRNGQAAEALALTAMSSCVAGAFSVAAFLLVSPILAEFALAFGPPEFFVLIVFGLTVLASIESLNVLRGILGGLIGMSISMVGTDPYWAAERVTFGLPQLYEGVPFGPFLLGLFCIAQMMELLEGGPPTEEQEVKVSTGLGGTIRGMVMTFRYYGALIQGCFTGTVVGALPGAGATIAAFVSYTIAKATSPHPERFGTGTPEGVIAPEAANNSVVGGALIPTFTLGIPGSGAAAILMGVMMFHGLRPGPRLFLEQLPLIQTLAGYLLIGCLLMAFCGGTVAMFFYRITRIPIAILGPVVIVGAAIGAYAGRTEPFDVGIMVGAGLLGYTLNRNKVPLAGVVLGMVLGPACEDYLIQSLEMSGDDWSIFFQSPLCLVLWGLIALSLFGAQMLAKRERKLANRIPAA